MPKILVIEDEPAVRELLALVLGRNNTVQQAATASDAHRLSAVEEFDLLIVDVVLPGGRSGTEFVLDLIAVKPRTRAVFISGYPVHHWRKFDRDNLNGIPERAYSILQKPFLPSELEESIGELMVRHTDASG